LTWDHHPSPILVECKAHTWTAGGNTPSAKLSGWNEAMYYFLAAPPKYRKVLFVLKSLSNNMSLGEHYIRRFEHLIPEGEAIWEFDPNIENATCIYGEYKIYQKTVHKAVDSVLNNPKFNMNATNISSRLRNSKALDRACKVLNQFDNKF
jgi:hypothetical protein